jgi:plasmid replication initiation protein
MKPYAGIGCLIARRSLDPQFDLFVPYITDLPLRDQRETMERPFLSLAKRKRLKPIEYVSPTGEVFVNVFPNAKSGMATIWDPDILIWGKPPPAGRYDLRDGTGAKFELRR